MVATDESLAADIAARMNPDAGTTSSEIISEEIEPEKKYEFEPNYQEKIAALYVRDVTFARKTEGLISSDHFEDQSLSYLVDKAVTFYEKYDQTPDKTSFIHIVLADLKKNKSIRSDMRADILTTLKALYSADLAGADLAAEEVAQFANHQDFTRGMLKAMDAFEKGDIAKAKSVMDSHGNIGMQSDLGVVDYFADIDKRIQRRKDVLAGIIAPAGISTGVRRIDSRLLHKGYGRGELTLYMGPPKIGKSTALMFAGKAAALNGHNVLIVSLEVDSDIATMRIDADMADMTVDDINNKPLDAVPRLESLAKRGVGKLMIHQELSNSFTPSDLRRMINKYKSKGIMFDLIALDYLALMAPNVRTPGQPIADSKNITLDVRAIAQRENLAMVSAVQTNREGIKAPVADMTHVAEDINVIRIADLTIAINADDAERARSEARLRFVASRNQEAGFTIRILQDLTKMRFIDGVKGYE